MKPRYRPGKPATNNKKSREAVAGAKPLTSQQMKHLGGERASWDIDYEEGIKYDKRIMKNAEYEGFSHDGIRKLPKNRSR